MFDSAGRQFAVARRSVVSELDALDTALVALGFVPPPRQAADRQVACGVALRVSVQEVLGSDAGATAFLDRVTRLFERRVPISLAPVNFAGDVSVIAEWQRFCERIVTSRAWHRRQANDVSLVMPAHQMPLEAYCLIADAILGRGPRYVSLDRLQMTPHGNAEVERRSRASWLYLWQQRARRRPVMPVYGGVVRSACPLLSDEVAPIVLPVSGLQCPEDSAWLPLILPVTSVAGNDGKIHWQKLSGVLRQGLTIVEEMHNRVQWHGPGQRDDAGQNRRVALQLQGIGDLVLKSGRDPASLDCLRHALDIVGRIRSELQSESGRIAGDCGPLPSLVEANHVRHWTAGPKTESWRRHWDEALKHAAVRHRNMLTISPYSVLPTGPAATPAFGDLLPVIAFADAWNFAEPPDFHGWHASHFRHFHRRAGAIIRESQSASCIAAGV